MKIDRTRTFVTRVLLSLLFATCPAAAAEPNRSEKQLNAAASRTEESQGHLEPDRPDRTSQLASTRSASIQGLAPRESLLLKSAIRLAARHLDERSECSQLFNKLSGDGATHLQSALYRSATAKEEEQICRPGVAMFTEVGGAEIGICPGTVRRLDRSALAALLIHEALHLAGLNERPPVMAAPTSAEINRQVRKGCSL